MSFESPSYDNTSEKINNNTEKLEGIVPINKDVIANVNATEKEDNKIDDDFASGMDDLLNSVDNSINPDVQGNVKEKKIVTINRLVDNNDGTADLNLLGKGKSHRLSFITERSAYNALKIQMFDLIINELNKDKIDKIIKFKGIIAPDISKCDYDKSTGIMTYNGVIDLDKIKKLNS